MRIKPQIFPFRSNEENGQACDNLVVFKKGGEIPKYGQLTPIQDARQVKNNRHKEVCAWAEALKEKKF